MPDLSAGWCQPGRSRYPVTLWVSPSGAGEREAARHLCASCPALADCRAWAVSGMPSGPYAADDMSIMAGLTRRERDAAARKAAREAAAAALPVPRSGRMTAEEAARLRGDPPPRRRAATARAGLATATGCAPDPAALGDLARIARTGVRQRIIAALLRDPRRSNRAVAAEAASDHATVRAVRGELEQAGLVARYRAPSANIAPRRAPKRGRVRDLLLADPRRPNRTVAADAGVSYRVVLLARHELEAAGLIAVYRAPPVADSWTGYCRDGTGRWAGRAVPWPPVLVPAPAPTVTSPARCLATVGLPWNRERNSTRGAGHRHRARGRGGRHRPALGRACGNPAECNPALAGAVSRCLISG